MAAPNNYDEEAKKRINELYATVHPMSEYMGRFSEEMSIVKPRISTGILNIDIALNGGLQNELYIMGAETSTGKSAIMMWLAQNIAKNGTDVLYFALEMGKNEFVARGISALSFEKWIKDQTVRKYTAGDVLYWSYDTEIKDFSRIPYHAYESLSQEYFSRYGSHLYIIEGGMGGLCAADVGNLAYKFKNETGRAPVVFVDYLQLLKADPNDRSQTDRKTKVDTSVTILKTLASQIGMPVFVVSSIGRTSYNGRVSSAAFKESGDTEYTGGVLIGWNWTGVTDQSDDDEKEFEKIKCYNQGYRRMSFEVLKYRNSVRDNQVDLIYYPAYSYFVDENDFHDVPDTSLPPEFQKKLPEKEDKKKKKDVIEG